jgi:ATP-dependent Clp protease ATP-binding subunit ClpA
MMFERFTNSARQIVVQAQSQARQFGHGFIGPEHLLLALVSLDEPAAVVLHDQGLTPERTRAEVIRMVGPGRTFGLLAGLDREALASIGIDLDTVRSRIEATFGPDALIRAAPVARRRRHRLPGRKGRRGPSRGVLFQAPGSAPRGHIPFTPLAKKALERSLREALTLGDNYIGVQHVALALISMDRGCVPVILSALSLSDAPLRAAILDRYRKAS